MSKARPLSILTKGALGAIEGSAYRLLAEVGISLQHATATEMLHGQGCRVENRRVLIPQDTVQWALQNVTPQREFFTPDGSHAFTLGDGRVRFHSGGGLPFMLDLDTGKRRQPLLSDIADASRLMDALPNIDAIIPLFGAQDVRPELLAVASTEATLRNTRKPAWSAPVDNPKYVPYLVEMAAACCGGMDAFLERPTTCLMVSPVSPLLFTESIAAAIIAVAQSGTPFLSLPAPSLGATGPVTMAGGLAQQHAEVLASFVLAAAARPGARVVYCSRISTVDPRTAISIWGGPEVGMTGACAGQLAHRLGMPANTYGLATSSSLLDPQFAYERLANALVPALAGVDILSGAGSTANVMAAGLQIAVLDDEIIGQLKRIVVGCEVNETTLAYDVMRDVIRRDGVFLGEMHTVKEMRKGSVWVPTISTRSDAGAGGCVKAARARAREILGAHQVEPLSDDASRHLDEIMARARRDLLED